MDILDNRKKFKVESMTIESDNVFGDSLNPSIELLNRFNVSMTDRISYILSNNEESRGDRLMSIAKLLFPFRNVHDELIFRDKNLSELETYYIELKNGNEYILGLDDSMILISDELPVNSSNHLGSYNLTMSYSNRTRGLEDGLDIMKISKSYTTPENPDDIIDEVLWKRKNPRKFSKLELRIINDFHKRVDGKLRFSVGDKFDPVVFQSNGVMYISPSINMTDYLYRIPFDLVFTDIKPLDGPVTLSEMGLNYPFNEVLFDTDDSDRYNFEE